MYKTFKIGEKEVPANVNAALPYRYQQVFHEDFMALIGKEIEPGKAMDFGAKILFIANASAEKKDMGKLNFESFIEFLEGLGNGDLMSASSEIVQFAFEASTPAVNPKGEPGPQKG